MVLDVGGGQAEAGGEDGASLKLVGGDVGQPVPQIGGFDGRRPTAGGGRPGRGGDGHRGDPSSNGGEPAHATPLAKPDYWPYYSLRACTMTGVQVRFFSTETGCLRVPLPPRAFLAPRPKLGDS